MSAVNLHFPTPRIQITKQKKTGQISKTSSCIELEVIKTPKNQVIEKVWDTTFKNQPLDILNCYFCVFKNALEFFKAIKVTILKPEINLSKKLEFIRNLNFLIQDKRLPHSQLGNKGIEKVLREIYQHAQVQLKQAKTEREAKEANMHATLCYFKYLKLSTGIHQNKLSQTNDTPILFSHLRPEDIQSSSPIDLNKILSALLSINSKELYITNGLGMFGARLGAEPIAISQDETVEVNVAYVLKLLRDDINHLLDYLLEFMEPFEFAKGVREPENENYLSRINHSIAADYSCRLSFFIAKTILSQEEDGKINALFLFHRLFSELKKENNFESALAVLSGIRENSVERLEKLKTLFKKLYPQEATALEDFSEKMTTSSNGYLRNIYAQLEESPGAKFIPGLSLYIGDLMKIAEVTSIVNEREEVNIKTLEQFNETIKKLFNPLPRRPFKKLKTNLFELLLTVPIGEGAKDVLWRLSCRIESPANPELLL